MGQTPDNEQNTSNRLKAVALLLTAASTLSSALSNFIHLITNFSNLKGGIGLPIFTLIMDFPIFIYCQYVTWREYAKMKNATPEAQQNKKIAFWIGIAEGIGLTALSIGDFSTIFWPVAFTIAGPILTILAFSIFAGLALRDLAIQIKQYRNPELGQLTEKERKMQRIQMLWKLLSIIGCLGVVAVIGSLIGTPIGLPVIAGLMLGFGLLRVVSSLSTPVKIKHQISVSSEKSEEKDNTLAPSPSQKPLLSNKAKPKQDNLL